MPATFDGENLIITLPLATDQINVQVDLYSDWKEWFKTGTNAKYPQAFRAIGGDPLTANIDAGAYYFIRNDLGWRIRPAEENATVQIEGNLAPEDASLPIAIPTIGNYTVLLLGLQPITQNVDGIIAAQDEALHFSKFQNEVTIDATSPYSGTGTDPLVGTKEYPVNNVPDAIAIAERIGVDKLYIIGDLTLALGDDVSGYKVMGQSTPLTTVTVTADASVNGTCFDELTLTGELSGEVCIENCHVSDLSGLSGGVISSRLAGTVVLSGSTTIVNCANSTLPPSHPIIDMGGVGYPLGVHGYSGDLELRNLSGDVNVSLSIVAGELILDSTVSAGTIIVSGNAFLIDNSTGTTTVDDARESQRTIDELSGQVVAAADIADAVWREVVADHAAEVGSFAELLEFMKSIEGGKQVITDTGGGTLICYKSDNLTEIARFALYDENGARTDDITKIVRRNRL